MDALPCYSDTNNMIKNVKFIFLAEFDIDKGSVLRYQYPPSCLSENTYLSESYLAEHMLPEGVHNRSNDHTVFYTKVTAAAAAEEELLKSLAVIQTKKSKAVRRGAIVKSLAISTHYSGNPSNIICSFIIFINIYIIVYIGYMAMKPLLEKTLERYFEVCEKHSLDYRELRRRAQERKVNHYIPIL